MKLVYACNGMLALPSRLEKEKEEEEKNERRKGRLYNTQFTLHAENSERFSKDLDFSLWTRVTLTFVYENIIITALNHIPGGGRFDFTITRNKRDIRDRERPLKIMLFVSLA